MKTCMERLKELMEIKEISQSDIVEKTGLPKSAVSMYVNGKREPRHDKIDIIANAYNVSSGWLIGFDVPMDKSDPKEIGSEYGNLLKKYSMLPPKAQSTVLNLVNDLYDTYFPSDNE